MALRAPPARALIDELGALTFGEIHARGNALAQPWRSAASSAGDGVAIMCRNHRGFVDALVAIAKLGADILLLNTAFAGPQLAEVLEREMPAGGHPRRGVHRPARRRRHRARVLGWIDGDADEEHLDDLDHVVRRLRPPTCRAARPDRDPHLGHHRHPQGRASQRGRARRRRRAAVADPAARTAGAPTSRHRSSTPGVSPTWRSRCCWTRPSCCAAVSTPRRA